MPLSTESAEIFNKESFMASEISPKQVHFDVNKHVMLIPLEKKIKLDLIERKFDEMKDSITSPRDKKKRIIEQKLKSKQDMIDQKMFLINFHRYNSDRLHKYMRSFYK